MPVHYQFHGPGSFEYTKPDGSRGVAFSGAAFSSGEDYTAENGVTVLTPAPPVPEKPAVAKNQKPTGSKPKAAKKDD